MRPFIFLLALMFTTFYANSQKVRIGIVGGPYFSSNTRENITFDRNGPNDRARSVHGILSYFGGCVVSVPLSKHLAIKPQIEYVRKGWRNRVDYADNTTREDFDTKVKAHCIDLPLNLIYNIPTRNGRFFLGMGPYFSYVLSGKIYNVQNAGASYSLTFNSSDTSTTAYPTNRFDIGGTVLAGYEFRNGLFCTLHYAHGFRDFRIELENDINPHNKNVGVGLGIGYMFKLSK